MHLHSIAYVFSSSSTLFALSIIVFFICCFYYITLHTFFQLLYISLTNHRIAFSCHSDFGCIAKPLYSLQATALTSWCYALCFVVRKTFAEQSALTRSQAFLAASFRLIIYLRRTQSHPLLRRYVCHSSSLVSRTAGTYSVSGTSCFISLNKSSNSSPIHQ